jgi:hypothetical protein
MFLTRYANPAPLFRGDDLVLNPSWHACRMAFSSERCGAILWIRDGMPTPKSDTAIETRRCLG